MYHFGFTSLVHIVFVVLPRKNSNMEVHQAASDLDTLITCRF